MGRSKGKSATLRELQQKDRSNSQSFRERSAAPSLKMISESEGLKDSKYVPEREEFMKIVK